MSEKKVVVQVLADTKPFMKSMLRIRKLAESLDQKQFKSSSKLLENVRKRTNFEAKIMKMSEKLSKIDDKRNKENLKSQNKLIKGFNVIKEATSFAIKVAGYAYNAGRDIVDPARVFGLSGEESSKVNALYSAAGGKSDGGADVLSKFMQNKLDFELYQKGALKDAASRFRIDVNALRSSDFLGFIKQLREIVKTRGFDDFRTQGLLQAVGMGGDAAIQRLVSSSEESFNEMVKKYEDAQKLDKKESESIEEIEKNVESLKNNVKTLGVKVLSKLGDSSEILSKPEVAEVANYGLGASAIGAGVGLATGVGAVTGAAAFGIPVVLAGGATIAATEGAKSLMDYGVSKVTGIKGLTLDDFMTVANMFSSGPSNKEPVVTRQQTNNRTNNLNINISGATSNEVKEEIRDSAFKFFNRGPM